MRELKAGWRDVNVNGVVMKISFVSSNNAAGFGCFDINLVSIQTIMTKMTDGDVSLTGLEGFGDVSGLDVDAMIAGNIGVLDSNGLSRGKQSSKGIESNEQRALQWTGHDNDRMRMMEVKRQCY